MMSRLDVRAVRCSIVVALATPAVAFAHPGHEDGFVGAFMHPLLGWDHLLAMVLVGVLAAMARRERQSLLIPAAFIGGAAVGLLSGSWFAASGALSVALEPAILGSVVVLGLAVALLARPPLRTTAAVCALFGLVHGLAHGIELDGQVLSIASGMLIATILLHGAGYLAFRARGIRASMTVRLFGLSAASLAAVAAITRFA